MIKVCTDLYADPRIAPRLAVDRDKLWPNQIIRINFLEGTPKQKVKVLVAAEEWRKHANISFEWYSEPSKASVRIAFREGKGSWSYVGTDALAQTAASKPTMNFGWLYDDTDEEEFSRVVLHEFGHMLGAIHEHQSPDARINWNRTAVYKFYWETQRWSPQMVDQNIFDKYDGDISNTIFDPRSIMLYSIPADLTTDGVGTQMNTELSDKDIELICEMYPYPRSGRG